MMLSICKVEVYNLDMKYIINNLIMNGYVKLGDVTKWWESMADIWVQMTTSLIYYRFIVRFTIGLEFLLIQFLLRLFLAQTCSLSISSSATYPSTFSNHIYLSIDIISVYLKVTMHQGTVLSPLLFVVMAVVPSEARSGIHSELLYADDLVLMAPIMEPLGRRVTEYRVSLLHKEQMVNGGKYKVMVGSSDGNCNLWKVTMWEKRAGKHCYVPSI